MSDATNQVSVNASSHKLRWPLWRIILAYAAMTVLAIASIWFVDRKVHVLRFSPHSQPSSAAAAASR